MDKKKIEKAKDLIDEAFGESDDDQVRFYLGSAMDSLEVLLDE